MFFLGGELREYLFLEGEYLLTTEGKFSNRYG